MGAGFDRIARAIASDMPRRKVLKVLVGGAIASVGTSIMGDAALAAPSQQDQPGSPALIGVNCPPPPVHINVTHPPIRFNGTYPPIHINVTHPPIGINRTLGHPHP